MGNFKNRLIPFAILLALTLRADAAELTCIHIISSQGQKVPLFVELASSPKEQQQGLMNRTNLPENQGMLFVFHNTRFRNFWMKNTRIPLSIAYIGADGVIFQILDMKPMNTRIIYTSRYPARFALEVNRGWFQKHNITPGCRIIMNGCIGK